MTPAVPHPGIEAALPLPDLIAGLSDPEAYGERGPVRVVQTHISAVFLVGERAYKIKKPVRLWGYLDYGTLDARRHWCEEEVRLNRRAAPDTYLGVEPVVRRADGSLRVGGEGEVVEHAVVMRRWPAGATFLDRLERGALGEADVRDAAVALAAFHRANVLPIEAGRAALPSAFGEIVAHNLEATRAGVPDPLPEAVHESVAHRIGRHLRKTSDLSRARLAAGRVVDGHGDVRLEHVIRRDGRVDFVDCVEFAAGARHVDGLSDMAFLSVDLAARGRGDLAELLELAYLDVAQEDPGEAAELMPLFRAYRAHVRVKVDLDTARSPEVPADLREARRLGAMRWLALAWTYARADDVPPVILLRGPSGVGKSVLATALAPWLDAEIVRSDLVRKELAGLSPTDRVDEERRKTLYGSTMGARTYTEVLARAEAHVRAGRAVLLDATWLQRASRHEAWETARRLRAPFGIVDVTCPDEVVRARLRAREAANTDASDAGIPVYEEQVATAEPLAGDERGVAITADSREAPERCVLPLLERLELETREGL